MIGCVHRDNHLGGVQEEEEVLEASPPQMSYGWSQFVLLQVRDSSMVYTTSRFTEPVAAVEWRTSFHLVA